MDSSRRRLVGVSLLVLAWVYGNAAALYLLFTPSFVPPASAAALGIGGGVAILAFDLLYLGFAVRDLLWRQGGGYVVSRTDLGMARISLRAIQTSLLRRARETEDVLAARVGLRRPAARRLVVEVTLSTGEGTDAIEVSERLRRALQERFAELVHPEEGFQTDFEVSIEGLAPRAGSAERPAEKEREPFTGPRYPIE
jgi:hypothetical protein